MKKIALFLVSAILVSVMVAAALPASASDPLDFYTPAADGDLLYQVNFFGDEYWKPENTKGAINVIPIDDKSAEIFPDNDKAQNWYGGEVAGLPLEGNAYTIEFTVTRNATACFGIYVDGMFGAYGYANQYHLMNVASELAGHPYVKYENVGLDIPGINNDGTPQNYALEVNAQKYTLKLFIKDKAGAWQLVDESVEGEIPIFVTDNLGIYFYQYYVQHAIISDIMIYKGMTVTGEKLDEVTTPAVTEPPVTTAPVVTEPVTTAPVTTDAPKTTDAPATTASTTKAPETAGDKEKSGCGSAIAGSAVVLAAAAAAVVCTRKKKK